MFFMLAANVATFLVNLFAFAMMRSAMSCVSLGASSWETSIISLGFILSLVALMMGEYLFYSKKRSFRADFFLSQFILFQGKIEELKNEEYSEPFLKIQLILYLSTKNFSMIN